MLAKPRQLIFFLIFLVFAIANTNAESDAPDFGISDIIEESKEKRHLRSCCGPLALARSLQIVGSGESFAKLLKEFKTKTSEGVGFSELVQITQKYHPEAQPVVVDSSTLDDLPIPAILIVKNKRHCVVLEGVSSDGGTVVVWDPQILGSLKLTLEQVHSHWDGEAIFFQEVPANHFLTKLLLGGAAAGMVAVFLISWFCSESKPQDRD